MQRCLEALQAYLRITRSNESELSAVAQHFVEYLQTHAVDPDNALVSLQASSRALKELLGQSAVDELLSRRDAEEKMQQWV